MPIGDEDHRVVARTVAAFLGSAQELPHFVVGEIGAKASVGSHENEATAKHFVFKGEICGSLRGIVALGDQREQPHASRVTSISAPCPARPLFSGAGNWQPYAQRVASRAGGVALD
jgi:hypothetical protein